MGFTLCWSNIAYNEIYLREKRLEILWINSMPNNKNDSLDVRRMRFSYKEGFSSSLLNILRAKC